MEAGLPVSKFFDRDAPNVPRCQVGFINFIVSPLYTELGGLLHLPLLISHLKANLAQMEDECAAAEHKATQAAPKSEALV